MVVEALGLGEVVKGSKRVGHGHLENIRTVSSPAVRFEGEVHVPGGRIVDGFLLGLNRMMFPVLVGYRRSTEGGDGRDRCWEGAVSLKESDLSDQ